MNVQQFCCDGLNFGYFYQGSPIIVVDDEPPPGYSMGDFTASTVPGCRAPHFWLEDGRSVYDAFGQGYTLLRFDPEVDVAPLVAAAGARRVPLTVLDVGDWWICCGECGRKRCRWRLECGPERPG